MPEAARKIPITVKVNGQSYAREVEPRQLLVEFIRETLELTGTHIGCDTTYCGACTVLLNDAAVNKYCEDVDARLLGLRRHFLSDNVYLLMEAVHATTPSDGPVMAPQIH